MLFMLAVFMTFIAVGEASEDTRGRKMIVIVADYVSFSDWSGGGLRHLDRASDMGALGLMVTRTITHDSETASHATLGAGLPAEEHPDGGLALNASEDFGGRSGKIVYRSRVGTPLPGNPVLHIGVGPLNRINAATNWEARPGALGSILRKNGLKTAVVGNSDFAGELRRFATLIAMDEKGRVDNGNVTRDLLADSTLAPWGVSMDMQKFQASISEAVAENDFIVVDYGDAARAGKFALVASGEAHKKAVEKAMAGLDGLVAFILEKVDLEKTQVVILSPTPSLEAIEKKETLTPILVFGAGIKRPPCILSSRSTRRQGIVLNNDFAPHVCDFFGIEPASDFTGGPFIAKPHPEPEAFLTALYERDVFVENRSGMLRNVVILHLAMLALCFSAVLSLQRISRGWRTAIQAGIIFASCMFISFLFMAGFPQLDTPLGFLGGYFGVCLVLALAAWLMPGIELKMIFIAGICFFSLAIDQFTGGALIRNSVLGYYPQIGARFYGIGNEFMGFMISAPLVMIGLAMDLKKEWRIKIKVLSVLFLPLVVFIVGSPNYGANFGGLLSCSVAGICMLVLIFGVRLNWKTISVILVAAAVIVVAFLVSNIILPGGDSHIGQLVGRMLHGGGLAELAKVIGRKIAVNMRLLIVSFWSALFLLSLAIALVAKYLPIERIKTVLDEHEYFKHAYGASLTGAVTAFAVNDSGIVPGATAFILPTAVFFLFLFNQEMQAPSSAKGTTAGAKTGKPKKKSHPRKSGDKSENGGDNRDSGNNRKK